MATITQLKYILAVEKYRHFGKAAKSCFVSQPSLSLQIQKVEEDFGFLIFDRTKKPVSLTSRGESVILEARLVIETYQRMLDKVHHDLEGVQGVFRLALIPTILPTLLPFFVQKFCASYPNVQLVIEERTTEDSLLALHEGVIDAAILATPLSENGIRERVLYYEPFHLYAHKEHYLLTQPKVHIHSLPSSDMWLLRDGHCFKNQMMAICAVREHHPIIPNLDFEGNSFDALRNLIRIGSGYTLFPQLYIDGLSTKEKEQQTRTFDEPIPVREISLVYTKRQWKTEITDALYQCIRSNLPTSLSTSSNRRVIGID